jgi:dipeptide/tripeptide permease
MDWLFGAKGNILSGWILIAGGVVIAIIGIVQGAYLWGLAVAAIAIAAGLFRFWWGKRFLRRTA